MYLLYMDESGTPTGTGERYFVVGGLALNEEDCWPFARHIEKKAKSLLPPRHADLELHASRMWAGRREWSPVSRKTRDMALRGIFEVMQSWRAASGRAPRYFAVAVHKDSYPRADIASKAHEELFLRLGGFIGRLHNLHGQSHRALVIADESSYESVAQHMVPRWKLRGTHAGRLHALAEVPLYVDSKASRNIQIADFVAWAVYRYYEHGDPTFLQYLNRRLDAAGGVQHGLTHLVRGYHECPCGACDSRRRKVVRTKVSPLRL